MIIFETELGDIVKQGDQFAIVKYTTDGRWCYEPIDIEYLWDKQIQEAPEVSDLDRFNLDLVKNREYQYPGYSAEELDELIKDDITEFNFTVEFRSAGYSYGTNRNGTIKTLALNNDNDIREKVYDYLIERLPIGRPFFWKKLPHQIAIMKKFLVRHANTTYYPKYVEGRVVAVKITGEN